MADAPTAEDFGKVLQALQAMQASLKALKSQVDGMDDEQNSESKNMTEHIKSNQSDFMKMGQAMDKLDHRISELEKKAKK